jgi:hypothetical protein
MKLKLICTAQKNEDLSILKVGDFLVYRFNNQIESDFLVEGEYPNFKAQRFDFFKNSGKNRLKVVRYGFLNIQWLDKPEVFKTDQQRSKSIEV